MGWWICFRANEGEREGELSHERGITIVEQLFEVKSDAAMDEEQHRSSDKLSVVSWNYN